MITRFIHAIWLGSGIFLILAAQYNSWTLPLSVMVVIPTVLLSAIAGLWPWGQGEILFGPGTTFLGG